MSETIGVVNYCHDCGAVREYPDGHGIAKCPRCSSENVQQSRRPQTKAESDRALLDAIEGSFNPLF